MCKGAVAHSYCAPNNKITVINTAKEMLSMYGVQDWWIGHKGRYAFAAVESLMVWEPLR